MILSALATGAATLQTPTLTLPGTLDKMPIIGYGTWLSKKGEVYEGTKSALKLGYRHIDEAWVYMNEQEVGRAITEALADGTVASRDELWVTSKLWQCHHRPELVKEGCLDSMKKLGDHQKHLLAEVLGQEVATAGAPLLGAGQGGVDHHQRDGDPHLVDRRVLLSCGLR